MSGLPASGKSTYAKELVDSGKGKWIRVNKDSLRTMLHFDKFNGKNEDATFASELLIAGFMLQMGLNVVVDDTNFNPKVFGKWFELAEKVGAELDSKTFDTDWKECIYRDRHREKSVGDHVIYKMALQYQLIEPEEFGKGLIVTDIDGTLANIEHRLHFVQNGKKDWKGFFGAMDGDTPRPEVVSDLLEAMRMGYAVMAVSARPEKYRAQTEAFIERALGMKIPLIMRPDSDSRDDTLVKKEIYEKYLKHYNLVAVYDDRPKVIRMWREQGVHVIDCGDGIEF